MHTCMVWGNCNFKKNIPAEFRHAFARVLVSTLSNILYVNMVESWTKLFMLPKCVLPSAPHHGHRQPSSCCVKPRNVISLLPSGHVPNKVSARGTQFSDELDEKVAPAISLLLSMVCLERHSRYLLQGPSPQH